MKQKEYHLCNKTIFQQISLQVQHTCLKKKYINKSLPFFQIKKMFVWKP